MYRIISDPQLDTPEVLLHPVCCVGLCHDEFSKRLKKSFPTYHKEYTRQCLRGHLSLGKPFEFNLDVLFGTRVIITWPIRQTWKEINRPEILRPAVRAVHDLLCHIQAETIYCPELSGPPSDWLQKEFGKLQNVSKVEQEPVAVSTLT